MGRVDGTIAAASMRLANSVSRRGFLGGVTKGMTVFLGGSAASVLLAQRADATHVNESIYCENDPSVGYNGCPNCNGGCWYECDNKCGDRATKWCDCCRGCAEGCHTHQAPNGHNGYSCCFTGYCGSGCSGKKVTCRYYSCSQLVC